jgi:3D-(3,5/4)-trihydroxycyclohexane-1,2-dione acylhydrolase (decyclizing)
MKTRRLTLGGAIVEFLKAQYVERDGRESRLVNGVFGIFGHGNVAGLGQALADYGGRELPHFQPKNEQAMVHAAIAYAKARRGLGAMACTTSIGPGATNMVTGAATATVNRLPVLLMPGDIFASRWPAPVLQQLESPHSMDVSVNDAFRPVSRYWDRLNRPEQALVALPEAMRVMADPSSYGAVTLALPQDVQAEAYDYPEHFFEKRVYRVTRPRPDATDLKQAVRLLRRAKRPLLIAGGGVFYSEAEAALLAFAEATGIPVAVTHAGKGVLADDHPLCMGGMGVSGTQAADRLAAAADLVLCVGTRLSDFTTASKTQFQAEGVRFVGVNLSAFDARKHGALPLAGDARATLQALSRALHDQRVPRAWTAEVAAAKKAWDVLHHRLTHPRKQRGSKLHQAEVIRLLNEQVDERTTMVHAAGGLPGDLLKLWKSRTSGDYHSEYGYSCMGYEIAGALGIKLAHPEREVYAFVGDGSYLMLNHEIVSSIQERRKITVLLVDNHGFQCIHSLQKACGGEQFGNEFRARTARSGRLDGEFVPVDYAANARSLGASVFTANTAAELEQAFLLARAEKRSCLIYVPIEPRAGLPGFSWWDVPVAQVSPAKGNRAAQRGYQKGLRKRRLYY